MTLQSAGDNIEVLCTAKCCTSAILSPQGKVDIAYVHQQHRYTFKASYRCCEAASEGKICI